MKFIRNIFLFLYRIYAIILFISLMILFLPFMMLSALFGIRVGGNIIFSIIRVWAIIWYALCGLRHKVIGAQPPHEDGPFIFVANHTSYLDAPLCIMTLRGQLRALGKEEMRRIPLFGWIYRYGVILVDRSDKENRAKSVRVLKRVIEKKINIMIFPEGTFNRTENVMSKFYDGAFRIAIETQTPIVPLVYLDVEKCLPRDSFWKLTPGKSTAVFLEKVEVEGMSADDISVLREKVFAEMEKEIKKYK